MSRQLRTYTCTREQEANAHDGTLRDSRVRAADEHRGRRLAIVGKLGKEARRFVADGRTEASVAVGEVCRALSVYRRQEGNSAPTTSETLAAMKLKDPTSGVAPTAAEAEGRARGAEDES